MDYQEKMRVFAVGLATGALAGILLGINIQTYKVDKTKEQDRAEATSNLVSAVDALLDKTKNEMFSISEKVVQHSGISREEKVAYLRANLDSVTQIEIARRQIVKNAEDYAAGIIPDSKASTNKLPYKVYLNPEIFN